MLGKLVKYEFKATARLFLPMFGALAAVALVNRLFGFMGKAEPWGISVAIAVVLMIGIIAGALIITIQRFSKNLLQNEGYLMMTLPVKTESLIISKLLVSTVWYVTGFIVVVCSILLMASVDIGIDDILSLFRSISAASPGETAQAALLVTEFIAAAIFSLFSATLLMYACLSLGMLASGRRGLYSFLAFLAITTMTQIAGSIATGVVYATGVWRAFEDWPVFSIIQLVLLLVIVIELIGSAVFFLLTRYMLKRRLNLQ